MTEAKVERSQGEKDRELWTAFNALANQNPEGRLTQIEMLIEDGATTALFEDSELGEYNYAGAARDFLEGRFANEPRRERDIVRALHLLLHAGRAAWTNREYVGNGGVASIWWCFDYLACLARPRRYARPVSGSPEKLRRIQSWMSALAVNTPEDDGAWETFLDGFWGSFVPALRSFNRLEKYQKIQFDSIFELGLYHSFHSVGLELSHSYWLGARGIPLSDKYHPITRTLGALVESQSHEHLSKLLSYFEKSEGILGSLSLEDEETIPLIKNSLGAFLRSRESRQLAIEFIQRSKWLRRFLIRTKYFCFAVVKKRERRLLKVLLKHEAPALRHLRDSQGKSLLLSACSQRGRNEKLIQLLIDYQFNPLVTDGAGLNAISLAKANKKEALARLMESRERS